MPSAASAGTTSPDAANLDLPPIDYAAEHKAAEWLAKVIKNGYVNLRMQDGTIEQLSPTQRSVPGGSFAVELVNVQESGIDDTGMANLGGCRRLQNVELSRNPISCAGLVHLKDAKTISELSFHSSLVDNQLWSLLAHWPRLQTLWLGCEQLTDEGIAAMPDLPDLRQLNVGGTGVTDKGLATLGSRCPNVDELHIWQDDSARIDQTLASVHHFPKMTSLWCGSGQVTEEGVSASLSHPVFNTLHIQSRPSDGVYQRLIPLRDKLKSLLVVSDALTDSPPTPRGFVNLAQQRALETLEIYGVQGSPTDADLQVIATLPQLKSLLLKFGQESAWPKFPDARRQYTVAGLEAFRKVRPDVTVTSDDILYSPTAEPGSVTIPSPPPLPAAAAVIAAPELPAADGSLSGTLAPQELRMSEGTANRPPFNEPFRPGDPLGEFAAVSRPAKVEGMLSWSIEPLVHRGWITTSAVSSKGIIATGGADCVIRLWTADWQLINVLPGHANALYSLEFSPDGERLISVANNPRAMVAMWDIGSGQLIWSMAVNMWNGQVSWAPDGNRIAVCESERLLLLDAKTSAPLGELKRPVYLMKAAWSSDSRRICLVNEGESYVLIIDAASMAISQEIPHPPMDRGADWSADGRWLAVTAVGNTVIYDANTLAERLTLQGNGAGVAFSPDSTKLAIAHDGETAVYNTSDWAVIWRQPGHTLNVSWSMDGQWLMSRMNRYDAATGKLLGTAPQVLSRSIASPTVDGSRIATISDRALQIWNGDDGSRIHEFLDPRHSNQQLVWNPQGTRLLRLGIIEDSQQIAAEVIDPESGKTLNNLKGHDGRTWRVCWSHGGKLAATVGEHGSCIIWDTSTGQQIHVMKDAEPQWWVQWSPDDRVIASASQTVVTVWDATSGEQKRAFRTLTQWFATPNGILTNAAPFCFMKDANQLTVLGKGDTFDVLNITTGQITSLGAVSSPGSGGLRNTVAWSPDFKTLGVPTGYLEFELLQQGTAEGKAARFFVQPNWLGDSRRVLGGDNESGFITGLDVKSMRRLGTLFPDLPNGEYMALGADGNYIGSPAVGDQVVVVALLKNGSLKTFSLAEFTATFGWKNDPAKVRFLKLRR
ncbi:MAG: hypothetical protein O2856_06785 [Planctomycetota bacterium]|nr:hypothetical protein [Planctomycetota bacterium]